MIAHLGFNGSPHPPVGQDTLQPGDWFTFENTRQAEAWVKLANDKAMHLRTGRILTFTRKDIDMVYRVSAYVITTAIP